MDHSFSYHYIVVEGFFFSSVCCWLLIACCMQCPCKTALVWDHLFKSKTRIEWFSCGTGEQHLFLLWHQMFLQSALTSLQCPPSAHFRDFPLPITSEVYLVTCWWLEEELSVEIVLTPHKRREASWGMWRNPSTHQEASLVLPDFPGSIFLVTKSLHQSFPLRLYGHIFL